MMLLFHGSVVGWFPALSPLSHLQLIIPSLSFFFLEAALLSGFASSLSSIALMHLVRLSVSESQLSHFWITEPSRVCAFYLKPHLHRSSSLTFSLTFFSFSPETMAPIPKKLRTPNPHLILLRVLMNGEEKSWYPRKGPIVSYCVLLSLCITGSR